MTKRKSSPGNNDTSPYPLPHQSTAEALGPEQQGMVIANFGASLIVEDELGQTHRCIAWQNLAALVCGDTVGWRASPDGIGIVVRLEQRHSILARPDKRGQRKIIAANIDQILIVTAPKPALNEGLIDRYLVAAESTDITPMIVLNKTDLLDEGTLKNYRQQLNLYEDIGFDVILTSAKTSTGLDHLIHHLHNRCNVIVGQSGVGKSSLINQLIPQSNVRTGHISNASGKGRHTTSTAWLYHLADDQGAIIDSPGIREFGLWQVSPEQLAMGFREFRSYLGHCKFRNCLHKNEPGCAIYAAVDAGEITRKRYESYLRIFESLSAPH